jgi:hypothetical protein
MSMADESDAETETLKLILEELDAKVTRQIDSTKGIDAKAGILAGFAATAATFLAGRDVQPVLATAAHAAYGVAFVFALTALAVTAYKDVPDARVLVNEYAREPKLRRRKCATVSVRVARDDGSRIGPVSRSVRCADGVVHYLAEQVGVEDPLCVKAWNSSQEARALRQRHPG